MNQRQSNRCIILIEDNLGDVVLFRESLAETDCTVDLKVYRTYEEVEASILEIETAYTDAHMIVLLDLNLLRCSGFDIIPLLKNNSVLQHLPIIIFTSSQAPKDVTRAFQSGVNAYVPKPDDLDGYRSVAKSLVNFWLMHAVTKASVNLAN